MAQTIQVGLAILKITLLYTFWGAREPGKGFEQSLSKIGCAQKVLFDFSPVVKVHQVVSCSAEIFKKQVVPGLCVPGPVFLFTSSSDSEALMHLSNLEELRSSKKT